MAQINEGDIAKEVIKFENVYLNSIRIENHCQVGHMKEVFYPSNP